MADDMYTVIRTLGDTASRILVVGSSRDLHGRFADAARNVGSAAGYIPVEVEAVVNWATRGTGQTFHLQGGTAETETRVLNLATVVSFASAVVE